MPGIPEIHLETVGLPVPDLAGGLAEGLRHLLLVDLEHLGRRLDM